MTTVPHSDPPAERGAESSEEPTVPEAVRSTESYEAEEGVVFYDAENPLAWLQSDHVVDLDTSA